MYWIYIRESGLLIKKVFPNSVNEAELTSLKDELTLVKEVLESKDQVVVSLTEKVNAS